MKSESKVLMLALLFVGPFAQGVSPKRISSRVVDLGKVHKVVMSPGMLTMIEIPEPITGVRTGSPDADLRVILPKEPNNEVDLVLQHADSRPTNLIIRAGAKKYIFDIIPSPKANRAHQDVYQVIGAYGAPELDSSELENNSKTTTLSEGT